MLINLKSHINMKHTQIRNKREEEENISEKRVDHHEAMSA